MDIFVKVNVLVLFGISLVLLLNSGGSNIYAQNFANQTNGQNNTQQSQQQIDQVNQQKQQSQQQANQSKQQDSKLNEKLLNYTNTAILALNDGKKNTAKDNLHQIQSALINASGKQVVIVPAPAAP